MMYWKNVSESQWGTSNGPVDEWMYVCVGGQISTGWKISTGWVGKYMGGWMSR